MTQQLDLASLYRLRQADILPAARFLEAARLLRDDAFWRCWGHRALLGLGLAHILAGIICFFAFNWADMPPFAKFAVIAAGIVLSALSSWLVGIHRPAGEALLIGASVLTGILLAVIGQVYQTGADAFQLFAAWGLVILPWLLVSRSAAHWAVWALIYYLAWSLYLAQVIEVLHPGRLMDLQCIGLAALVPIIALLLRELAVLADMRWMDDGWTRIVPLLIASSHLFSMAAGALLADIGIALIALAALLLGAAMGIYGRILPHFAAFATACAFLALLVAATGWRLVALGFDSLPLPEAERYTLLLFLMVLWCVGVAFVLQKLLRRAKPWIDEGRP